MPEDVRFCTEDVPFFPSKNGSHSGIFKAAMDELCRVRKCSQYRGRFVTQNPPGSKWNLNLKMEPEMEPQS